MKPILEIQQLSKKFTIRHEENPYLSLRDSIAGLFKPNHGMSKEDFYALKDLTFDVQQGESLGIIGKNGAGKSTLLKILSKISPPTSGKIISRGDTPLKHYSSGMQLRLAFAVAAFLEPEIMVIDEVLAVGDADFQKKCLEKMDDVSKSGRTILFVSHQMGTLARLCTRCILLREGTIAKQGEANEVIDYYLSSGENSTGRYQATAGHVEQKQMVFSAVETVDKDLKATDQFGYDDHIEVLMHIRVNEYIPNTKIGLAMLSKLDSRVFTVVKNTNELFDIGTGNFTVSVKLPANLFAPNNYSFTTAIFVPFGKTYDIQESICRIRVFDTGTELSIFEGIDYGNIIINGEWTLKTERK
ncbi:MAG: ABC transporter ATP-binding protein [Bacteroidetes bacterium]|nr:ABC transporter ATP-binding protein [Bacteroidota bacterium]